MRLRYAILLATILLPARLAPQAQPAKDPITGIWTGYIGRSEATPTPAMFELKLAAGSVSGSVTGPDLIPGNLKSGSFDPSTGVIKFIVVLHDAGNGDGGEIHFEGQVRGDSASGKMTLGNQTGVFRIARGIPGGVATGVPGGLPRPAAALAGDVGATLRRGFVEVSEWVTRAAELVPAEKYSYRPAPTVRTFGQLVGHIADGANYYCGRAAGKSVEWKDTTEKTVTTKPALAQALKQAMAACLSVYDAGGGQVAPLTENIAHTSLHYGNVITYLRMMGLVPPSS